MRKIGSIVALAVLCAGPGLARPRPDRAEPRVSGKPATRTEKAAAVPATPVAKGRLYAVVLGPGPAWKKGQPFKGPGLDAHRRYWNDLHAQGRVASAGPLGDRSGLALVRARSQKEADALIAGDPAVKARVLTEVARPYSADLVSAPVLAGK